MNASRENFLQQVPVMAGLDDEAIRYLSDLACEEHFPAGAVIIGEGEPGTRMFFIAAGHVVVIKAHGTAQAVALVQLGPGEFFGEMSLVESVADRKSTRLNSSHSDRSRMPSSA